MERRKVLWIFSCERWKVLAEWKSQMEESGRRKARFCTALNLEDSPMQSEKYPARPVTDMKSVVLDTGHRLTCSARVGATPAATAATNSCLAGFHGSAAGALNKWIIYWNTIKAGPSCLVRTPHLSHASQCCKAFLLGVGILAASGVMHMEPWLIYANCDKDHGLGHELLCSICFWQVLTTSGCQTLAFQTLPWGLGIECTFTLLI